MKYNKSSLTFEQQADLIISRGLIVDDKETLVNILHSVNYYRLSAYWYPCDFIVQIYRNTDRSNEEFVKHFKNKYHEEIHLPLWMVAELMTFGNMFTMFRNIDRQMRINLAKKYNLSAKVLASWLKTLNYVRNLCAHHARLES